MKVIYSKGSKNYIKAEDDIELDIRNNYNFATLAEIETAKVAKQVELMLVIGQKKSATSEVLYKVAIQVCNNAMLIETMDDLYLNYIRRFKIVGIVATEEMPEYLVERIVEILQNTQTKGYIYENSR